MGLSSKAWLLRWFMVIIFLTTVHRFVIPRFLPALSRGVLGELWPHIEDSADWVQGPQTDPHTQGGAPIPVRIPSSHSAPSLSAVSSHAFFPCGSLGRRWSRVLVGCCGREHLDGFLGERRGWLRTVEMQWLVDKFTEQLKENEPPAVLVID